MVLERRVSVAPAATNEQRDAEGDNDDRDHDDSNRDGATIIAVVSKGTIVVDDADEEMAGRRHCGVISPGWISGLYPFRRGDVTGVLEAKSG